MMMNPALAGPSNMGALPNMTGGMPAETPHMIADQSGSDENTMINVKSIEGKVKASAVKKVEDIVAAYPNETVSVLRGWMAQE